MLQAARRRSSTATVLRRQRRNDGAIAGTPRRRLLKNSTTTDGDTAMDIVTNIKDDDTWDDPTAIVIEEATERSVVALGMAQQSIFVVRPWSTAVLVPYQQAAPTLLSKEQRLISEFDRVALQMAAEFAEDLQVFQDTVWTIIAQGRLLLDYATIDACKTEIFSNFRREYNVE